MISFIEGKIEYIYQNRVIVNKDGIGFEINLPNKMITSSDKEDESIYFARIDFLKSAIKREPKFQDVDDVTIDGLLDENYQNLFG